MAMGSSEPSGWQRQPPAWWLVSPRAVLETFACWQGGLVAVSKVLVRQQWGDAAVCWFLRHWDKEKLFAFVMLLVEKLEMEPYSN